MTNKEITKVIFNNSEISALYYGDVLIWKKGNGSTFEEGVFAGKLVDGVTTEKAFIYVRNSEYPDITKIDLPYNDDTKEFYWKSENELLNFDTYNKEIFKEIHNYPNWKNMNSLMDEFSGCTNLISINLSNFDTANAKSMSSMFYRCLVLPSLDLSNSNFKTTNCKDMKYMFAYCNVLTSLTLSKFDVTKVTDVLGMSDMFYNCKALTTVTGVFEGIQVDLDLHYSPLTNASAMVFINGLSTAISTTRTLSLKSSTYNTLTPEQIAVATSKGWTVISA